MLTVVSLQEPIVSWTPPSGLECPSWWPQHDHQTTTARPAPTTTSRMTTTKKVTTTTQKGELGRAASSFEHPLTCVLSPAQTTTRAEQTTKCNGCAPRPTTTKKATTQVATTPRKPATTTKKPATTSHAAATTTQKPAMTPKPSPPSGGADWQCDGSGNDGKEVDHNGNGCPSHFPSGWLWFGM